jgi:hypothetical protein
VRAAEQIALIPCDIERASTNPPTKPGKNPFGLEEAHRDLNISPAEFDEVAARARALG